MDAGLLLFSSKPSLNLPQLIPIWSMDTHILNKIIITIDYISKWTYYFESYFINFPYFPRINTVLTFVAFSMNITMPLL